jgi:crotonobetainyl-CoA:carnitine CoA-transferase CaiB-like acyl-CoA transferase
MTQPGPAPRFGATPLASATPLRTLGADTDAVLAEAGVGTEELADLRARGVVA